MFNVLANDTRATGGLVTITAQPRLGRAMVNVDGTISFTPTDSNVNGADALTYTVTVAGKLSNTAVASFTINPSTTRRSVSTILQSRRPARRQ